MPKISKELGRAIDGLVIILALLIAIIVYEAITGKVRVVNGKFERIEGGPKVEKVSSPSP